MTEPQSPPVQSQEQLPDVIPILPLFDAALFPKMVLPLVVMEASSVRLVDEAMAAKRIVGMVVSRKHLKTESTEKTAEEKPAGEKPGPEDMAEIGTAALILKMAKTEDDKAQMLVQGLTRFKITRFVEGKPYLQARIVPLTDVVHQDTETEALKTNLQNLFEKIVDLSPGLPQEVVAMAKSLHDAGLLADMVASTINSTVAEKQDVLETLDVKKRLKTVTRIATRQLEILELGKKIQSQVKGDMDRSQREYYLRQQLKAIREELGEKDESQVELEDYRARIEAANLPEEAKKEAKRELNRLSRMHPSSAEYTVAVTYLDWITSLPWHTVTED
ncbi:MAG: endopeptidase La, partial [Deltaproteobacteria bacterium]